MTAERKYSTRDEFNDKKSAEAFRAAGFERVPEKGDGKVFTDIDEMLMAYQDEIVDIHAKVKGENVSGRKTTREEDW